MHYTTVKNPIHLVHITDGIIYTFANYDQLVAGWKHIRHLGIGAQSKVIYEGSEWMQEVRRIRREDWLNNVAWPAYHHDHTLRDSIGDNIDPSDVAHDYAKAHPVRRYCGWRHKAYGGYRRVRTFQEAKWAKAWDDEEFAPKTRPSRTYRNLPDSYWDIEAHNEKCWKTQSKRRHQWKG